MAFTVTVNGSQLPYAGALYINGVALDRFFANGVEVWRKYYGQWSGNSIAQLGAGDRGIQTSGQSWRSYDTQYGHGAWRTSTSGLPFSVATSSNGDAVRLGTSSSGIRIGTGLSASWSSWLPFSWPDGFENSVTTWAAFGIGSVRLEGSAGGALRFGESGGNVGAWVTLQ